MYAPVGGRMLGLCRYFQNVVDIVRDLMSPTAEERSYKQGMRKDDDGFMDILWCGAAPLDSWNDLRATFLVANARKAISPTQFNHQSTRGHCIMTLETNMPKPDDPSTRQRGRVYVCDLAGTEPAGDIVYAAYKKIVFPDGTIDHVYKGPHPDQTKTKNLQNQGKKINLSLSEMAQFFMKMAKAILSKKLKPGSTIPGCNSYFLCKYLKDTMLQACMRVVGWVGRCLPVEGHKPTYTRWVPQQHIHALTHSFTSSFFSIGRFVGSAKAHCCQCVLVIAILRLHGVCMSMCVPRVGWLVGSRKFGIIIYAWWSIARRDCRLCFFGQARTYLFCAIRPEVKYANYTFSTLGFAKNASVIKLNPKKVRAFVQCI